jgi:putative ABC transport system permease protein
MDKLLQDIRFGLRMLRRSPGFACVVIVTLALGIGANSAIFSIISAVLLRPLPYKDSDRVVMLWETFGKQDFTQVPASVPNYLDWKEQSRSFEDMAAAYAMPEYGLNLVINGEPERVRGGRASSSLFPVLGVKPVLGRGFLEEEDKPGGPPVVLISQGLWKRRFGSDPQAIGRSVVVDGTPHLVVGVLPQEIQALGTVDLWTPRASSRSEPRGDHNIGVIARLKSEVSLKQAQAEMSAISQRLAKQYPDTNGEWGVVIIPIAQVFSGPIAPALVVLQVAVGFLLLIACANVASVLLARAVDRTKEMSIRAALGAKRSRIVYQLLTESVALALAGGALGLLLAGWGISVLRDMLPDLIPRLKTMSIDFRVLLFTAGLAVLTGILFGLAPALKASRSNLAQTLKEGSGKQAGSASSQRARSLLLIGEVALTLALSIGAGLLVKSFVRLMSVHPGLQAENVLTMSLSLPNAKYPEDQQKVDFFNRLIDRVETLPGVNSAAAISVLPLRSDFMNMRYNVAGFEVEGHPVAVRGQEPNADFRMITPGYFQTMGIGLQKGRVFNQQDVLGKTRVVIINETMARRHFSIENPIGKRLRVFPPNSDPYEVVGVVADVKLYGLSSPIEPAIYLPFSQNPRIAMHLVVNSSTDPAALSATVRREIMAVDREQPVAEVRTMRRVLSDSVMPQRLVTSLLSVFAGLALALGIVGIYGLSAVSVSQRTREIGIRMALGARRSDVLRMIIRKSLLVALAGVGLGIVGSLALTRALSGLLYGVAATDPLVFISIPLLLIAAAALASYVPARRATHVDPVVALRYE